MLFRSACSDLSQCCTDIIEALPVSEDAAAAGGCADKTGSHLPAADGGTCERRESEQEAVEPPGMFFDEEVATAADVVEAADRLFCSQSQSGPCLQAVIELHCPGGKINCDSLWAQWIPADCFFCVAVISLIGGFPCNGIQHGFA